jgi:hypothetical protein
MAKTPKADKWSPTQRKDPIKPGIADNLGGSYDISGKIEAQQRKDAMRGGSKRGKC